MPGGCGRLFVMYAAAGAGPRLARFAPSLQSLGLHLPESFAALAPAVAQLQGLRTVELWLPRAEPIAPALPVLAELPRLTELRLRGAQGFDDASLQILSTCPALEVLTLESLPSPATSPEGFQVLTRLPRLRRLTTDLPMGQGALAALSGAGCRVASRAARR